MSQDTCLAPRRSRPVTSIQGAAWAGAVLLALAFLASAHGPRQPDQTSAIPAGIPDWHGNVMRSGHPDEGVSHSTWVTP